MAYQEAFWQDFYEQAWAMRAEFMKECLKNGLNAYQAINALEKQERKFETKSIEGTTCWNERKFDKENTMPIINRPIFRTSTKVGEYMILPYYCKFDFTDLLIDFYEETGPYDCIIELGCGYGKNLFNFFYKTGIDIQYFGGEFTKSGVEMAKELAAATPKMCANFFHFNHLEPKIDLPKFKKALVFTCHTIEQVKEIPENWFEIVSKVADFVYCIHLEPFGFQVQELGKATKNHKDFFIEQGWNLNFADTLQKAIDKQIVYLDSTILEIGGSEDPFNPSSIAIWHSNNT